MGSEYRLKFTTAARKDAKRIEKAGLKKRAEQQLKTIKRDPFEPPLEKLIGTKTRQYSRRINIQHRLVYEVFEKERIIKVVSMFNHYDD